MFSLENITDMEIPSRCQCPEIWEMSPAINENSCGALSCIVTLQPGESKTILFVLGMDTFEKRAEILASYKNPQEQILQEVETH